MRHGGRRMARPRRRCATRASGAADARRAPSPTRSCTRDARAGAAELEGLGAARGTRVGIALPAGADFARALHACLLLGAPAVPIDLRLSESEQQRVRRGCDVVLDEPLPRARRRRRRREPSRRRARTRPRPRRDRAGDAHLGHQRRAEGGRAHLRQPAVERPRLGRGARSSRRGALAVRDAALAHGRPLDPGAQLDLRHHRRAPRGLRARRRAAARFASSG